MPLFKEGSFGDIGLEMQQEAVPLWDRIGDQVEARVARIIPLRAMGELSYRMEIPTFGLARSSSSWSIYLKKITLNKSFEGFIPKVFHLHPTNEIYFSSFAWDYSGDPPVAFPPKGTDPATLIIKMKPPESREFIGDGVDLWPSRPVTGSLNLVLLVYENDDEVRKIGDVMEQVHDAISSSKLNDLLLAISANPTLATAVAVEAAVNEVLGVVGKIMKGNKNDFVDMFEGSWGTEKDHSTNVATYGRSEDAAEVEIEFVTTKA